MERAEAGMEGVHAPGHGKIPENPAPAALKSPQTPRSAAATGTLGRRLRGRKGRSRPRARGYQRTVASPGRMVEWAFPIVMTCEHKAVETWMADCCTLRLEYILARLKITGRDSRGMGRSRLRGR